MYEFGWYTRAMNRTKRSLLTFSEVDLSLNFYDTARNFPLESFKEITTRTLGSKGFSNYTHADEFERECQTMFDLARIPN